MNKQDCKTVITKAAGTIARKIAESAVHAAVFAFVSKKVTNFMSKQEEKDKVRINDGTKTGGVTSESTERI